MTSKLIPADPSSVMVIRKVTPNITTCSAPFARFGHFKIGGRGTIVRLPNNTLAVFSPTALTPEVRSAVAELGNNVQYISALDFEHHIFITEWAKAFPNATLLGVEGLPEKRQASKEAAGTNFQHVWTQKNKAGFKVDPDFDAAFDYEYVGSHGNKELVFLYKPDRTLIEADLLFNLPATEQYSKTKTGAESGLLTKLFVGLMSARDDAKWQKRFLWYAASSKDREGFNKSVNRINDWDFERIIPCHGDVIESGAKGIFQNVMAWHIQGKKSS
ncbi:hypothetical protein MMC34_001944 [Xylographa carneopallida]|nr:hypothetical protein [Xylographa carneopallida]